MFEAGGVPARTLRATHLEDAMITVSSADAYEGTIGACLACSELAYGVEPDARRYKCDSCGAACVYGLEELALMGHLELTDDA